jgi:tetratricopeptide (TPR) repeat protein
VYTAQGDLEAAIQEFSRAIQANPGTPSAYLNRGLVYLQQGKVDDALSDFDEYIDRWPSNIADVYIGRGVAHYRQQAFDAAIQDFDKAIQLRPDSAGAYYNRGLVHADQDDLLAAIADYDQAIELDPTYAGAYYNRGKIHYDQGDLAAAIADYNQAITLDLNYATAYNSLCWSYSLQGQPKLALPHCQRAIELNPDPYYYDSQGLAHALLGNFPAAITDFQTYVDFLETLNDPAMSKYLETRKQWIATLKAGNNPFTPAVLEALKQE